MAHKFRYIVEQFSEEEIRNLASELTNFDKNTALPILKDLQKLIHKRNFHITRPEISLTLNKTVKELEKSTSLSNA